jgi:hypothetical protein
LLTGLAACTSPSAAPAHEGTPSAGTTSPAASPQPKRAFTVESLATLDLAGTDIGPPAMDDRRVVFPFGNVASGGWDRVAAYVPGEQAPRAIARSQWSDGFVNWVAVAGDWVAWVDQSHRQGDDDPRVLWRVRALNTATGERRLLAGNGDVPDPYVPQVHGHGRALFWTQAEPDRSAREMVRRPSWAQPRTLMRHTEMTPGSETAIRGNLVYLGPAGRPGQGHTVGGDCGAVPLDGSAPPRPHTRTALAMGCAAAAGRVVWTEHVDPAGPVPADGELDDPYEVHATTISVGPDRLLHRGYLPTGYPVAGRGFALWTGSDGRLVVHGTTSDATVRFPGRADRVASNGDDLVAYATATSTGTTLRVVRLTPSP